VSRARVLERKPNPAPVAARDFVSLSASLVPGVGFAGGLLFLWLTDDRFGWVWLPASQPVELWIVALCGVVGTAGGTADWLYHRLYVAAGPREHRAHVLALAGGGVPLFLLMAAASVSVDPRPYLVPILVFALATTVVICYDEFMFHQRRCLPVENAMHWASVFGNGAAWLAWMHWIFG